MASGAVQTGVEAQITTGLFKMGLVLRHQAWQASGQRGLTPTQSQILALLATADGGVAVSSVAQQLAITKGTASEAISTLEHKGHLRKQADPDDGRVVMLTLTARGRREARRSVAWPEIVLHAIGDLPPTEQAGLVRGLLGLIRSLQDRGAIPTARMCAECVHFRPNHHPGRAKPHHCNFLGAAIADTDLRIDCAEMEPAADEVRAQLVRALFAGAPLDPNSLPDS